MINSKSGELLAKWYLRFNGFFVVENFVVHAGNDLSKISKNIVGNHTEVDVLAIRHKFSKEIAGSLLMQNDEKLSNVNDSIIDFVIVEVKTGLSSKPNKVWVKKNIDVIKYIIRFGGFIEHEKEIAEIALQLAEKGFFHDDNKRYSIRLVLISEVKVNSNWSHLINITFDQIIDFLVEIRGQCWLEENIGVASIHYQWEDIINEIFTVANNQGINLEERKKLINRIIKDS